MLFHDPSADKMVPKRLIQLRQGLFHRSHEAQSFAFIFGLSQLPSRLSTTCLPIYVILNELLQVNTWFLCKIMQSSESLWVILCRPRWRWRRWWDWWRWTTSRRCTTVCAARDSSQREDLEQKWMILNVHWILLSLALLSFT